MGISTQKEIPSVLERYENKYTIPFSMIDSISNFVEAYASMDEYSLKSDDHFYTVNSLYFDTPNYLFLRNRMYKMPYRFNMRIRTYGQEPVGQKSMYFFEVKHKTGNIVRKQRAKVELEQTCLDNYIHTYAEHQIHKNQKINHFYELLTQYNAKPKVLTQYRRKAYISEYDDYARVTFDIELKSTPRDICHPWPADSKMRSCDHETYFDDGASVILELKCCAHYVPCWMLDLIRVFDLHQRGFSKYTTGVMPYLNTYLNEEDYD